jgi:hypothetical protein
MPLHQSHLKLPHPQNKTFSKHGTVYNDTNILPFFTTSFPTTNGNAVCLQILYTLKMQMSCCSPKWDESLPPKGVITQDITWNLLSTTVENYILYTWWHMIMMCDNGSCTAKKKKAEMKGYRYYRKAQEMSTQTVLRRLIHFREQNTKVVNDSSETKTETKQRHHRC